MSGHHSSVTPSAASPVPDTEAADEARDVQRCCGDIAALVQLPSAWRGRDPTSIAESLLETLLDMLDLDFIGLRFNDTDHVFSRTGPAFGRAHHQEAALAAVAPWFRGGPDPDPPTCRVDDSHLFVASFPLGALSGLGCLVAASRRIGFPRQTERLRLRVAATQASLAIREVRELSARLPPADPRVEKPTGKDLADREWKLNLAINTIPAMAWSTTPDGRLDFCNQHYLDFVGRSFEEVKGLGYWSIFHPDDIPQLLHPWQEMMASKRGGEVQGRIRRADGEYRWNMFRANPLLDPDGNILKWYGVNSDIEDRKRAEDALRAAETALRASERNLSIIIDSLPVLAWVARPDGSADFVNRRWAEYAGVEPDRILGWGFLDFYHPDDVDGMVVTWKDCLATKDEMGLKGRIRRFDGEYRWFYFAGRKITDANGVVRWVGVNVDFEDLQRAEDALKASEHRLKLIIDTIPAMSWSSTADGAVDFWSKSLLDFCGISFEDVAGEGYAHIFHPEDLEASLACWERVRKAKRGEEIDARLRRADGEYRWFTLRQNPLLDANGEVVKWYGALIEIEDRKRAEEELRLNQSELARVARVITLGELAVSIAHEVNQPLMAIVTNAGTCVRWLDETQFDAAQARRAAERVVRDGHRAGDIIASIRALASKSPARMEPTDLHEAIREVLLVLNGEFRRRGVAARFEATSDPLVVLGDRTQLQQVVLNMVMNGVEAMAETETGRRRLTIRSAAGDDGFARISVSDTGSGLSSAPTDRIFEAFFSTKPDGMGMGLSICRSIVETHGGAISASNNPLRGSTFSFSVPMARAAAQ